MFDFFKREAKAVDDEFDTFGTAIEAELKKLGHEAETIIHHDILDHAADTVASLKAKALADKNKIVARLKEIEQEASGLIENNQHVDAVIHMAESFLSGLVGATDAPGAQQAAADPALASAPASTDTPAADTAVAAALTPAAE